MARHFALICFLAVAATALASEPSDLEDQTRAIATELRCVVCQNLSVADSPSEMAQQMRGIVREQLQAGKTPQEIKNFFVSKYGEWVLLAPTPKGFGLVVWVLPFVVLFAGLGLAIWFARRWSANRNRAEPGAVDPALLARVRSGLTTEEQPASEPEDSGPRSALLQERSRLYAELRELDFDYQAGKLSAVDYAALRRESESKAVAVLQQLDLLPSAASPTQAEAKSDPAHPAAGKTAESGGSLRGWKLAAAGAFLLLFGVTLGIFLTQSVRPRASEQDSITGDFLTGTGPSKPASNEVATLLQEAKAAFDKQEWPKAIEAFKRVLAADASQPEAHAYMGFILLQAGHADGALMAFDRSLAAAPDFPMALWGKGMTLYQAKQDYAGARRSLEKLLVIMPAGQERIEVEKVLAEMPQQGQAPRQISKSATETSTSPGQITGKISLDPKHKANVDSQAALFIIARPAGAGGGPPLAAKKIDRPLFPLSYSLGAENVMMQGRPFSGKVAISARLDKDGNAMTREAGNLTGDYKKNPVEVGATNVDIVLDQIAP